MPHGMFSESAICTDKNTMTINHKGTRKEEAMAYPNLRAEMARNNISQDNIKEDIAEMVVVKLMTIGDKNAALLEQERQKGE